MAGEALSRTGEHIASMTLIPSDHGKFHIYINDELKYVAAVHRRSNYDPTLNTYRAILEIPDNGIILKSSHSVSLTLSLMMTQMELNT